MDIFKLIIQGYAFQKTNGRWVATSATTVYIS